MNFTPTIQDLKYLSLPLLSIHVRLTAAVTISDLTKNVVGCGRQRAENARFNNAELI